jgi:hypothetical protein
MAASRTSARRRRARRGSPERPVNARLYRSAFLVVSLPLLVLAFSVTRPGSLPAPGLPPNFDGAAARELAVELATRFPDRTPGGSFGFAAADWFEQQLAPYRLPVVSDTWRQSAVGLGRVRLRNVWAVAAGDSPDAIVVMAHRDDTGEGPGANDNASGTAALVELARSYAQPDTPAAERVTPKHTIVFLSTDGGAFGGLGVERFLRRMPFHVTSVINLVAVAGNTPPRIVIAGDTPRSPKALLVETAAQRVLEQTSTRVRRSSFLDQLLDLAFPFTLYEQGPLVAHGIPAITVTTAGVRPPDAFVDRPQRLDTTRLTQLGRAAQALIGSLDEYNLELPSGTTSYVWAGDRIVRGWAIEFVLVALLVPFVVAVVDLFALCRRRQIPLAPAARSLRSRAAFWLFVGLLFYAFRGLGTWPGGAARPPNPALPAAGDWPVLALLGFALVALLGWSVARHRLVPRRRPSSEEFLAGETVALIALGIVSLLVVATNPFALLFFLPALHAWIWLPQVRTSPRAMRIAVLVVGLLGPALFLWSLASRYGLGLDAPWYAVELAGVGYIRAVPLAITLAAAACTAQLAAVTAGRYAPYPDTAERPARGPIREIVRAIVLASRRRRRVTEQRRRAFGG